MWTYTELEIIAWKCWATDDEDDKSKPMRELIWNGCPEEESVKIVKSDSPIKTRFSFNAFR